MTWQWNLKLISLLSYHFMFTTEIYHLEITRFLFYLKSWKIVNFCFLNKAFSYISPGWIFSFLPGFCGGGYKTSKKSKVCIFSCSTILLNFRFSSRLTKKCNISDNAGWEVKNWGEFQLKSVQFMCNCDWKLSCSSAFLHYVQLYISLISIDRHLVQALKPLVSRG